MHDGRTVKGLVDVARDGYLWMLERTADKINFVAGYRRQIDGSWKIVCYIVSPTGPPRLAAAAKRH